MTKHLEGCRWVGSFTAVVGRHLDSNSWRRVGASASVCWGEFSWVVSNAAPTLGYPR